mmetsp:Transcript_40821/g.108184  ORF Transcript_40821/g.108184 Transcript_40821/m.108184 type:complete len:207 (-) Transcript_40821:526-1146(-)
MHIPRPTWPNLVWPPTSDEAPPRSLQQSPPQNLKSRGVMSCVSISSVSGASPMSNTSVKLTLGCTSESVHHSRCSHTYSSKPDTGLSAAVSSSASCFARVSEISTDLSISPTAVENDDLLPSLGFMNWPPSNTKVLAVSFGVMPTSCHPSKPMLMMEVLRQRQPSTTSPQAGVSCSPTTCTPRRSTFRSTSTCCEGSRRADNSKKP